MRFTPALLAIFTFSFLIISCEEEEVAPVKKQCEISNTGTFKIINRTPYSITVKLNGGTPSNMGSIGAGDDASVEVTAGINHTFAIQTVQTSSAKYNWNFTNSVGACITNELVIQL